MAAPARFQPRKIEELLEPVARSFYLTVRVLPAAIRQQIGLAYLLARASDTIADTEAVGLERRLEALRAFREKVLERAPGPLDLGELRLAQTSSGEARLLQQLDEALHRLGYFSEEDQQRIRKVLETILSGQELDLVRFGAASARSIGCLETDAELDDYTYRVAGCVGEFWTRLCRAHLFPHQRLDEPGLIEQGIRFGKGLQLVNILRDIPADLRQGRCYLPRRRLQEMGLEPGALLDPAIEGTVRPLFDQYLAQAEGFLEEGWQYTLALPFGQFRLRLACAWPVLIGRRTIGELRARSFLDPDQRVKVTRRQVKRMMMRSILALPFPGAWRRLQTRF